MKKMPPSLKLGYSVGYPNKYVYTRKYIKYFLEDCPARSVRIKFIQNQMSLSDDHYFMTTILETTAEFFSKNILHDPKMSKDLKLWRVKFNSWYELYLKSLSENISPAAHSLFTVITDEARIDSAFTMFYYLMNHQCLTAQKEKSFIGFHLEQIHRSNQSLRNQHSFFNSLNCKLFQPKKHLEKIYSEESFLSAHKAYTDKTKLMLDDAVDSFDLEKMSVVYRFGCGGILENYGSKLADFFQKAVKEKKKVELIRFMKAVKYSSVAYGKPAWNTFERAFTKRLCA